jgi:hypothetical protein
MTSTTLRDPIKPTLADYRHMLRANFGPRRYRITRHGEIHAYGTMPGSSDAIGWWWYGSIGEADTIDRLFGDKYL